MQNFYSDMQTIATDVLRDFSQGIVEYVALTPGGGPPDNPGEPVEVITRFNAAVRGVAADYVDNSTVIVTDLQAVLEIKEGVTPSIDGFIRVDGVKFKIIRVITKPAAGVPVVNIIIFRK